MAPNWKTLHETKDLRDKDGDGSRLWARILDAHPDEATIFHTREWGRHVASAFPQLEDRSFLFEVESSSGISQHVLPLFAWVRARGLLTTEQSSFPFQYGGPIPTVDAAGEPVLPRVLERLGQRQTSFRIAGNPFGAPFEAGFGAHSQPHAETHAEPHSEASVGATSGSLPNGWTVSEDFTHLRSLPETDSAFWDDELKPGRRNDVRRMTKKGLLLEDGKPEDVPDLYRLYLESFDRWGGRPAFVHPEDYYGRLGDLPEGWVRFTVARWEGRTVGGVMALRYAGKVHYLAGYIDAEFRNLRANVLLQIDSIRHSIAEGYRTYDFLPSGGNPPVEAFKEGLGGARVPFPVHEKSSLAHQVVHSLRRGRGR